MLSFYILFSLIIYSSILETCAFKNGMVSNFIVLTGIKCVDYDKSFAYFAYCHLKPFNRTTKYVSLRVKLLKPPVTQSHMQFTMWKKANGYKPFVINMTLDTCKYLGGKKNPIADVFFDIWKSYTNINHSCPYTDDLIVEKVPLNSFKAPSAFPEGNYRVDVDVAAYGVFRAGVQIFVTIK